MLIIPANSLSGGFTVDHSCSFAESSSTDLRISDYSSDGTSRRKRTYSLWIKRGNTGYAVLFAGPLGAEHFVINENNTIQFNVGYGTDTRRVTSDTYTSTTAWVHIVFAFDTTQSSAANRFTLWINGTATSTSIVSGKNDVQQNEQSTLFINTTHLGRNTNIIGTDTESGGYTGLMAEFVFIDGQKLDADSFGYDDGGTWKPIDVSELTFGTNGFYLNFETASDLGIDAANDNDFEPTNISSSNQSSDTPTS